MKHLSHLIHQLENKSITKEELTRTINIAIKRAKAIKETILVSWSGDFDLLVYPSGNFQIVPLSSFKLYKISEQSDDHCVEVVL